MLRRLFLASALILLACVSVRAEDKKVKVLLITGDSYHKWTETTPFIKEFLTKAGIEVDVTETPSKDLTDENLAKYDVLLLNYTNTKGGKPESRWSDANKEAFTKAVKNGKGLVVYHHSSASFVGKDQFAQEFEKVIAGGWRGQGNHGKRHEFNVTIRKQDHPITKGLPLEFAHKIDELYQNSVMLPESVVLATAYSDKKIDTKNSDKHEPVVWVAEYGKGRVCENVLGHDVEAMKDLGFQTLLIRGVEWAATGEVHYPVPKELKGVEK